MGIVLGRTPDAALVKAAQLEHSVPHDRASQRVCRSFRPRRRDDLIHPACSAGAENSADERPAVWPLAGISGNVLPASDSKFNT